MFILGDLGDKQTQSFAKFLLPDVQDKRSMFYCQSYVQYIYLYTVSNDPNISPRKSLMHTMRAIIIICEKWSVKRT